MFWKRLGTSNLTCHLDKKPLTLVSRNEKQLSAITKFKYETVHSLLPNLLQTFSKLGSSAKKVRKYRPGIRRKEISVPHSSLLFINCLINTVTSESTWSQHALDTRNTNKDLYGQNPSPTYMCTTLPSTIKWTD